MNLISSIADLASFHSCACVPTMGALHKGHLALVHRAAQFNKPVVVSIFVNPTQFAPTEDLSKYPRTLDRDLELLRAANVAAVFTPDVETIYPKNNPIPTPQLPAVATQPRLEDAFRPTHFAGVCQVVARLFDLVKPSIAVFGEKDYQQLRVISDMIAHENAPSQFSQSSVSAAKSPARNGGERWPDLKIIAHPTIRDTDGLAMSSRNIYLTPEQRPQALGLSRALQHARTHDSPAAAEEAMARMLTEHHLAIDYAVVRDARTLMPISDFDRPARAIIAARLPTVRLIDNAAIH
ncbi:MAG TPA: pantoate--beta-alanine ligase [Phycisphaerales bacterium]|nr:pantoate--beta-alanine ligase [Phycisphaerales bacterium]